MSDLLDRTLGERIRIDVELASRRLADLRRPAPARKCDPQPRGQRARRDGRRRADAHRDRERRLAANEVGDIRAGDYVKISVTDTGCGMTARGARPRVRAVLHHQAGRQGHRPRPSARFSASPTSRAARSASKARSGRGTAVSIYLPRTEKAAEVRIHPAVQRREEADAHVAGARILLVEDDPRVRTATVGALEDLDYEPVACGSGAEAIELFAARSSTSSSATSSCRR